VLDSITVSRCHAVLVSDSAGVRLIDLESTNGTYLNGVQVPSDEAVRLADGNIIQIGQVSARYCGPAKTHLNYANIDQGRAPHHGCERGVSSALPAIE
jgi:pSer/pThr/pTyr-binding forkhead associated (FHA) protein